MIATIWSYLPLLLLTLAIECAVVALAARDRRREAVAVCIALNLLTHPMATLLSWRWGVNVLSLELLVFLFEWVGYSQLLRITTMKALRYALIANFCSALAGFGMDMVRMAG